MRKVKQIFALFFAAVVFLTTSGFAFHTIQCQITGDTYHSVIDKECCCAISTEARKCCNEESLVVKVDSQAALNELNFDVNQVLFGEFFTHFIKLFHPAVNKVNYLNYSEHSPPLHEQEIIILVQSFLL
ncbi:MAG: hypothetical protein KY428_07345 [Bacteroidetes bacterium]|nr:hypothetical protein [Bacteroidota bacterium]